MFEKDAEKIANEKLCATAMCYNHCNFNSPKHHRCGEWHRCYEIAKDSATFGYNKANEWHYVNWKYFADKDYPESELASYLVRLRNKDTLICEWEKEEGFGCFCDSNLEPIDNDDVYAWKEIVLPKESE